MEKKKLKKLTLKKDVVSNLSRQELSEIRGEGTTSMNYQYGGCTGFLCCGDSKSLGHTCCTGCGPTTQFSSFDS